MIREILRSDKNSLLLKLPDDLVGRLIEVIAFPVDENFPVKDTPSKGAGSFKNKIKAFAFNSGGYKFNRDEANDWRRRSSNPDPTGRFLERNREQIVVLRKEGA